MIRLPPQRPLMAAALLLFPAVSMHGQGPKNLSGLWSYDPARKQVYTDSVNAGRPGAPMSEIAAAMGLARIENSLYELGADREGPFLSITDKISKAATIIRVSVEKTSSELILRALDTGRQYRICPLGPSQIDLVDEQNGVTIPLTRH